LAEPAVHQLVKSEPAVEIIWRAFELRPDAVQTLDPKGEYLQRAWRDSVYPLASKLGVTMRLPPVQPRTRLAHQAAHWALSQGRFDDYHAAVFRAFFERGEDIGDIEILITLSLELEMDGNSLRRALETYEFEKSVQEDEREAEAIGVRAVPAFIANRRAALSGVQPVKNLKKLVRLEVSTE
jgi:predicted DsbA family dithiol-disulfide isomerase